MEAAIDEEIEMKSELFSAQDLVDIDSDIRIRTSTELDPIYSGHIEVLTEDECQTSLITSKLMSADSQHMVHSGFISSAAEYAALVLINEPNGMVYGIQGEHFACARVGDEVRFTAQVRHIDSRKREVEVKARIEAIKIFSAKITIVIPEYHPLKIHLLEVAGAKH